MSTETPILHKELHRMHWAFCQRLFLILGSALQAQPAVITHTPTFSIANY
jgi:hypothetical protein